MFRIILVIIFIEKDLLFYAAAEWPRDLDAVIHLAALPSVRESWSELRRVHEINLSGTVHVWEGARHNHVPQFVFAPRDGTWVRACVTWLPMKPAAPVTGRVLLISIDLITARLSIAETELFHRFRARVDYLVEHLSPRTQNHSLYAVYRVTTRDGAQSD